MRRTVAVGRLAQGAQQRHPVVRHRRCLPLRTPVRRGLALTVGVISLSMSGALWSREPGGNETQTVMPAAAGQSDAAAATYGEQPATYDAAASVGASREAAATVAGDEEAASCMDWQSPAVDIIEGRFLAYGSIPNVRYAMGQVDLGLGVVRTAIELSWRVNGAARGQTLIDATTSGDFAGGVSFYRADDFLSAEYLQCGWDDKGCASHKLTYRFDPGLQLFVGEDDTSRDALIHICKPVYFDSERALRRARQ